MQEANLRDHENDFVRSSLRAVGIEVGDIYEFVRGHTPDLALPILLDMMRVVTHPAIKQGVIRALGSKSADKNVRKGLIEYYENIAPTEWAAEDTKWAIGNTLEIIAKEDILSDMIRIAVNQSHGKSREMVVLGLSKFKSDNVYDTLVGLLDDPIISGHAIIALRKFGDPRAISEIKKKLDDPKPWIRAEARKAIKKLTSQAAP
jgi:HEAT repeat protein